LFERIDHGVRNDGEASCCCVIAWSRDPDRFALEGVLRLEELQGRPRAAWSFIEPSAAEARRTCTGPVHALAYEVLLHVDQIVHYRAPSATSAEWPERRSFRCRLGFRDDWTRWGTQIRLPWDALATGSMFMKKDWSNNTAH
jgi:hypothetical protein